MERTIDIELEFEKLNKWVRKSILLFKKTSYLDDILKIYPYDIVHPVRLDPNTRRSIQMVHNSRDTDKLFEILDKLVKFPYEDPIWYSICLIKQGLKRNPIQRQRIENSLYSMTSEELVVRIEAPPKLNTTTGPMFTDRLYSTFKSLHPDKFEKSQKGTYLLLASEIEAKKFVQNILNTSIEKRPDIVLKKNKQYIIGEAKWIGSSGGNQDKSVNEVINFCSKQRASVRRIGIVDGYIWATHNKEDKIINLQGAVLIQESQYDIMSALLLQKYIKQF